MGLNTHVPKNLSIRGFFFFNPTDGHIFTGKTIDLHKKRFIKKMDRAFLVAQW